MDNDVGLSLHLPNYPFSVPSVFGALEQRYGCGFANPPVPETPPPEQNRPFPQTNPIFVGCSAWMIQPTAASSRMSVRVLDTAKFCVRPRGAGTGRFLALASHCLLLVFGVCVLASKTGLVSCSRHEKRPLRITWPKRPGPAGHTGCVVNLCSEKCGRCIQKQRNRLMCAPDRLVKKDI